MLMQPTPGITETLANLSIAWILTIVSILTVVRLGLIRVPTAGARSFAEILESGIIAIVLVFLVIRPFVLQAYFIPSPSMEPTLLGKDNVGDRILVNKFLYRFHPPRRDDVVVFLAPPAATEDSVEPNADFIKRLIGTPGDVVQAVHGSVEISGMSFNHMQVRDALGHAGDFGTDAEAESSIDQADHHVKFVDNGVLADGKFIPKQRVAQDLNMPAGEATVHPGYTIRDGQRMVATFAAEDPDYDMQLYQGRPLKHDFGAVNTAMEYKLGPPPDQAGAPQSLSREQYDQDRASAPEAIPPHLFLMMGDNRNDSNDGTNWGLLREKRVVGRAVFIFWPLPRLHPIR